MLRACGWIVIAGIIGATVPEAAQGQQRNAPRGYLFFSVRRPAQPAPAPRVAPAEARQQPAAGRVSPIGKTTAAATGPAAAAPTHAAPAVEYGPQPLVDSTGDSPILPVSWHTLYGMGTGYPESGYYPGLPGYGFGSPVPYPQHGYRTPYVWAGHSYSMHCYCRKLNCPWDCPGYRGECYRPCWNDAGPCGFERLCGRGSWLDCFWHQGGWECPRRCTDCPYDCCEPSYSSYGFPRGTFGDPHYRPATQAPVPNYYTPDALSRPYPRLVPPTDPAQPSGPAIPPERAAPRPQPVP